MHKAGLLHTKGCEPASSLRLSWNILEGEKSSKTHGNRKMKREGVVGREKGNGLCNLYKDFGQCSTKPQQRMKALYRWCFKNYISRFVSAFGCCAYVVFASHFLSHLSFKESCQHLWRPGILLSSFTSKSLAFCSGKAPVERHLKEQNIYFGLQLQRWKCLVNTCLRLPPHGETSE